MKDEDVKAMIQKLADQLYDEHKQTKFVVISESDFNELMGDLDSLRARLGSYFRRREHRKKQLALKQQFQESD